MSFSNENLESKTRIATKIFGLSQNRVYTVFSKTLADIADHPYSSLLGTSNNSLCVMRNPISSVNLIILS